MKTDSSKQRMSVGESGSVLPRSHASAILHGRCPRCLEGRIFRGMFAMNTHCPNCGLKFGREAGFFLGAMFVSYALAIPLLGALSFGLWYLLLPSWPLHWVLFPAIIPFLFLLPAIFRYSRIIWLHFEWLVYPP